MGKFWVFWPWKACAPLSDVMSCCSVTAEQSLLEPSHPQDEAEEELRNDLDESCSQEDEDSECWLPGVGCALSLEVGSLGAVWDLGEGTAALLSYIRAGISG